MLNRVTLMGRLVADPELRSTASNLSVCSFRIAVDRDYKKGDQKETDFIDIVAWRSTAEFVANYFKKGRVIAVDGRLQIRPWEDKDGNKRFATEVVADNVYFGDSRPNQNSQNGQNSQTGYPASGGDYGGYPAQDGSYGGCPAYGGYPPANQQGQFPRLMVMGLMKALYLALGRTNTQEVFKLCSGGEQFPARSDPHSMYEEI